jgi:hypothetical protein
MLEPQKREDLPPEVAAEIERRLKEMYPGMEVKFAGDEDPAELPQQMISQSDQMFAFWRDTLKKGVCRDCGKKIPMEPWPPENGTELPEDWNLYCTPDEKPMFLICSECEEEDAGEVVDISQPKP